MAPSTSGTSTGSTFKNVTFDDNDSSLKFSQGWKRSSSQNALGGGFQTSNMTGDGFTFTLPSNAVAVYYFGFKQEAGAFYRACIDCGSDNSGNFENVDAHASTKSDTQSPAILFSKTGLDPNSPHQLALVNFPDSRFNDKSTITVDKLVVTVQQPSTNPVPVQSLLNVDYTSTSSAACPDGCDASQTVTPDLPTASDTENSVPTLTSMTAVPTASQPIDSQADSHGSRNSNNLSTSSVKKGPSIPVLVAALVISAIVIATVILAVTAFLRRRRRRSRRPFIQIQSTPYHLPERPFSPSPPVVATRQVSSGMATRPLPRIPPPAPTRIPPPTMIPVTEDPFLQAEIEAQHLNSPDRYGNSRTNGRNTLVSPTATVFQLPLPPLHQSRQNDKWELV